MSRRLLPIATAAGLAMAAVLQARQHPDEAIGGASWLPAVAALAAFAAGVRLAPRREGWLLAAAGVTVPAATLPLPEAGGALPFAAALVLGQAVPALAGSAARPGSTGAAAITVAVIGLGLVPAALFDPAGTGCFTCPHNLLLVHGAEGARDDVVATALWAEAALCGALAVIALVHWARRPALARPQAAPVAVGGAMVAGLGAAGFVHAAVEGVPVVDPTARDLWLAQCAGLIAIAAGVALLVARDRRLSARMATLVAETIPPREQLEAGLARLLGDPSLRLAFPDSASAPAAGVTPLTRGREVVAELHHDPSLGQAPERIAAAARGAGLALEHASLRARLERELAELRASRARVVEVGDAERRRLERDLHDGAQQRLIALTVMLGDDPVRHEVRSALEELRRLAHGIHPVALTDAGLAMALTTLAEDARVPVRILAVPDGRFDDAVEAAAYRLVLDAVRTAERHGDGGAVTVRIGAGLVVAVELPGVGVAAARAGLAHANDRIVALDGTLDITEARIEARIPCAS
jgi:signal transduction histidine kinase